MILSPDDIEKTTVGETEVWTTPWRSSRVEAYVDLIDCTQILHDYLATKDVIPDFQSALEDDDDNSRHRARCVIASALPVPISPGIAPKTDDPSPEKG